MESQVDEAEVDKAFNWFTKMLGKRILYDGKMLTPETLKTQIRLYIAMRILNEEGLSIFAASKASASSPNTSAWAMCPRW